MGTDKNIKLHIVTDIKVSNMMMQSMDIFHKCSRLFTQYNKTFICPLSTSALLLGKNKYTTPIRDIMLENQRILDVVKKKRNLLRMPDPDEGKVNIFFENRNPRHMELCGHNRPAGFTTLKENRNFYNKLHLDLTNRNVKAYVENSVTGEIICYASTTEFAIAKQLYRTNDVMAVVNIAYILAERLKKTGLLRVTWRVTMDRTIEKVREFEGILVNSGISLTEPAIRVLQGPPETLPPRKLKRVLPVKMTRSMKLKGTTLRTDKKIKTRH